ncbi:Uncharacterised protein [Porphyromonas cangingivalis]|nr:Uncharacterised protein [Porphyromonas cangingivalis]
MTTQDSAKNAAPICMERMMAAFGWVISRKTRLHLLLSNRRVILQLQRLE